VDKQATLCTWRARPPRSTGNQPGAAAPGTGVHTAPRRESCADRRHPHRPQHLLLLLIVSLYKDKTLTTWAVDATASTRAPTLRWAPCSLVSSDWAGWAPTCATGCGPLASKSSGSAPGCWKLLVAALDQDPELVQLRGWVQDSGEGRWTVEEAINHAVPAPVISAALFARFASRQPDSPAMRAVAALRQQFGGHAVQQASPD
jgi:6-phosphogluconate dehydrogenase, C-terminal domain